MMKQSAIGNLVRFQVHVVEHVLLFHGHHDVEHLNSLNVVTDDQLLEQVKHQHRSAALLVNARSFSWVTLFSEEGSLRLVNGSFRRRADVIGAHNAHEERHELPKGVLVLLAAAIFLSMARSLDDQVEQRI